jgi:DNA-binding transcriptional LysR family regulator
VRVEQLEYIAAVTRLGSLRRAGEELHISQPALSETVRNLELELGVTLLDRQRSGAKISTDGRELLPHIVDILEAVDRLRTAADEQHKSNRSIRVGTVNAATVTLLMPAIAAFRHARGGTQVEVINTQQADIHRALLDGGLDLGLVNLLEGDDPAPDLVTAQLVTGRPVVCVRTDDPLAAQESISVDELRASSLIAMRAGYLMHRYLHRLFADDVPRFPYSTDGAEMGKLMVAQGLGVTVLPDYSIAGDPLERSGIITFRPVLGDGTQVALVMQHRQSRHLPEGVRVLRQALRERAALYRAAHTGDPVGRAADKVPLSPGRRIQ